MFWKRKKKESEKTSVSGNFWTTCSNNGAVYYYSSTTMPAIRKNGSYRYSGYRVKCGECNPEEYEKKYGDTCHLTKVEVMIDEEKASAMIMLGYNDRQIVWKVILDDLADDCDADNPDIRDGE